MVMVRRVGTQQPRVVWLSATQGEGEELTGEGARARLVVLAAEVGGQWSEETALFLGALVKARAQESHQLLQGRVTAAYIRRWSALLACSLARSFTLSLLEQRPVPSVRADVPSMHEGSQICLSTWSVFFVDGGASLFILFVIVDVFSSL